MMSSGSVPSPKATSRSVMTFFWSPSMMRLASRSPTLHALVIALRPLHRLHPGEQLQELLQRVVTLGTPVVDEIEADLALFGVDPVERLDLPGVDDRRIETGLDRLMEEHRVEDAPCRRIQPEGDIGHAEHGPDPRQLGLDLPDGIESDHRGPCAGRRHRWSGGR